MKHKAGANASSLSLNNGEKMIHYCSNKPHAILKVLEVSLFFLLVFEGNIEAEAFPYAFIDSLQLVYLLIVLLNF